MELACCIVTWHVGKLKNLDKLSDDFHPHQKCLAQEEGLWEEGKLYL